MKLAFFYARPEVEPVAVVAVTPYPSITPNRLSPWSIGGNSNHDPRPRWATCAESHEGQARVNAKALLCGDAETYARCVDPSATRWGGRAPWSPASAPSSAPSRGKALAVFPDMARGNLLQIKAAGEGYFKFMPQVLRESPYQKKEKNVN